nr:uncharacterized protein LOC117221368 [Megalopta genalis]
MDLGSIRMSKEDIQKLRNYELFFIVHKNMSEEQIIEQIRNCLQNGAEMNVLNEEGKTVLDVARSKNYENLVIFLSGLGGKTAFDLINSQQQIQQSTDTDSADDQEVGLQLHFAATCGNVKEIASVIKLRLPLEEITLTEAQLKLLKQVNDNGDTLLAVAAKNGRKDNVDFFIQCGIDINHLNKLKESAVDLAWDNKHYDIVLALLEADSNLPNRFDLTVLNEGNAQKELKEFVVERWNSFHKQIKENCLEDIKDITNAVQGRNLYLNSEGQSAMFTALVNKRFKIFAFLKSAGFMFKNEDEEECINKLTQVEKDMLRIVMISKFPQIDDEHILYLTSKSRSRSEKPDDKERIEKLYRSLDAIPEVSTILKVVQYIDYLDIVFDFDNENNNDINPTASKGTTDYSNGKIYITAKIEENEVLGTLAHELTHLAIQPHILAQYHDEGRRWLLNTDEEIKLLFDYYSDQAEGGTTYRCKKFIENSFFIKSRSSIQVLNEYLGEINNVIKYGIHLEHPINLNNFLKSNKQVLLLRTDSTLLSILSVYESLEIENRNYSIRDSLFSNSNFYREVRYKIYNLLCSAAAKILCIRYSFDSDTESLSKVLEILNTLLTQKSDKKIVFIIADCKVMEFNKIRRVLYKRCYKKTIAHKFTLNDLTEESQQKLLQREVILQGEKISLSKLIDKSDRNTKRIIDAETLQRLITNEVIKIGSIPLSMIDLEGAYSESVEEVNMDTFVDKLLSEESSDIYIVSGIPGLVTENKLIEYLVNADIGISKKSKLNDLKSRVAVLNKDPTRAVNNRIQLADDQFKKGDFRQICQYNRERKIYWIKLKHEGNVSKFMLQQIYNPDFYLKSDRFNNEVVIERNIKEMLVNSTFSEIVFISCKSKQEFRKWLKFSDIGEQMDFQANCNNHKIKFLNYQDDMSATFLKLVTRYDDRTFHLLKFERDQLIWYKTHGSLVNLSNYRATDYRNAKPLIGEDDLIKEIKDDKVVIIAGDPGIGKTSALVKLYESQYASEYGIKESIINSHWLITVNLKDHLDALRDIDFTVPTEIVKEITIFLSQVDKGISDDFTLKLLYTALVKSNFRKPLLIVLDGYDEVLEKEDKDVLTLLVEYIKDQTNAKLWITTRFLYQQTLENAVSTFATKLEPFDDVTTFKLIEKYLKNHLSLILSHEEFQSIFGNSVEIIENTRLQDYTEALLSKMDELFVTKQIGRPLQLYLVLEGSARYLKKLPYYVNDESPDFSYLGNDMREVFENFVDRKYSFHFEKVQVHERMTQVLDKEIFGYYHKILSQSLIASLGANKDIEEFKHILLSAGIIKSDGSNIQFIHSTVGDFFAAEVFFTWILKWKAEDLNKPINLNTQEYMLNEILSKADYQVIRTFLNSKLLKENVTNIQLQEKYYDKEILLLAAKEGNIGITSFVLDNSYHLNNIYAATCDQGRTLLHVAADSNQFDMVKFLVNRGLTDFNAKDNNGSTALHMAARHGYVDIVKYLANENLVDINAQDKNGTTVLHLAAWFGHSEIMRFLINEKQADYNIKDCDGRAMLQMVAIYGDIDMMKFLIDEHQADFTAKDYDGDTVLHMAASCGHLDLVKYLVNEKKIDVNAVEEEGTTILHMAACFGHMNVVEFLINEKNADVNAIDEDGDTVLHLTVSCGHFDVIKYLINEKNADFNAPNADGTTILHSAACFGYLDMIKFLINEKSVDINATNNAGKTVFLFAASYGHLAIVKYLINVKQVDINVKDDKGNTALHLATSCDHLDVVKFLIDEKNADFNARNNDDRTVLHTATAFGHLEIVKYLINEKQADYNATSMRDNTVLHLAAYYGHLDIVKYLVNEKQTNVNVKNNRGTTVLHVAACFGYLEIVKWLVKEKGARYDAQDNHGTTILHYAARTGQLDVVEFLVNEMHADVNTADYKGYTVAYWAVSCGHLDIVKFLLNNEKVDQKCKDEIFKAVLFFAATYDHLEIVKLLLNEERIPFEVNSDTGKTALHLAARHRKLNIVKFLINEKGADYNAKNEDGLTVLHTAACFNCWEVIEYLVNEKGADFNVVNRNGETVLQLAAHYGSLEIIKFLVDEKKIDVNAKDNNGRTLLYLAARSGQLDLVKFLVNERNADINTKDVEGDTILHLAVTCGQLDVVKFLVNDKKVDFNVKDRDGSTVLHTAVSFGYLEIVKFLVNEKRADFNAKDDDGTTVLHLAASCGNLSMVKFLVNEKNADIDVSDKNGTSVLHTAACFGYMEIVKFLINEKNADFNVVNSNGRTILHLAAWSGHLEIIKYLVNEKGADFNVKDIDGKTILHVAASCGHLNIVKFLVNEKKADLSCTDNIGRTVLHVAILRVFEFLKGSKSGAVRSTRRRF